MAMTADEAKEAVRRMVGAYPQMTPEQIAYWKDECRKREKWSLTLFNRAFDAHCAQGLSYIDTGLLHQLILREVALADGSPVGESEQQRRQKEHAQWEAGVAKMKQAIDRLTPEELAEHKAAIVAQMRASNHPMTNRLEQADPARSAWLQGLIYQRLQSLSAISD